MSVWLSTVRTAAVAAPGAGLPVAGRNSFYEELLLGVPGQAERHRRGGERVVVEAAGDGPDDLRTRHMPARASARARRRPGGLGGARGACRTQRVRRARGPGGGRSGGY